MITILTNACVCPIVKRHCLQVINAYLNILKEENNKKDANHIFVMASYLGVLWDNGNVDHWLYKNVRLAYLNINIDFFILT